jgi:cell division protein FtsZ
MQKRKKTKSKKVKESKKTQKTKPSFLEGPIHKTKIKVIGIGGGGSSIVSEIAQRIPILGKRKISFLAANTDFQALKKTSLKVKRFYFGKELTFGLGTGMNPQLGREAAEREKEKILQILKDQDLLILVACLGGGVGSGATPVFAKIAKKLGIITYGIFTLPFKFEGEKKAEIAKNSLRLVRRYLNTLTVIPNERIFQIIDKKTPLTKALSAINKNLARSLEALLEMIYQPGLINVDFADLKTILNERGKFAFLNTIQVKGEDKIQQAVKKLTSDPLYPYSIKGARGILFNISAQENLKLSQVNQISSSIWELSQGKAKIIFGITEDKKLKDKIKITLLAVGCRCQIPLGFAKKKKRPQKLIAKKEQKKEKKPKKKKVQKKKTKPKIKIKEQKEEKLANLVTREAKSQPKIRRNALEVKKVLEEEEKKLLAKEKIWEIPAFLRRKKV